jgi:hypothetical protein
MVALVLLQRSIVIVIKIWRSKMKKVMSFFVLALAVLSLGVATAEARRGADDPAGHARHQGEGAGHP